MTKIIPNCDVNHIGISSNLLLLDITNFNPMDKNKLNVSADNICISMIVSTYKDNPIRNKNVTLIKNACTKLNILLKEKNITPYKLNVLNGKILHLKESVEYKKITYAVGFFVSLTTSELIYFDIPLSDKIMIGKNFELKDILLSELSHLPCYLIILNERRVRILKAKGEQVEEIKNKFFPFKIKDEFQHSTSRNLLSRGLEETDINMKRLISELKAADKEIKKIFHNKNLPVIVCGLNKILSSYKKINKNHFPYSYYFELNFDKASLYHIGKFASKIIRKLYETNVQNIFNNLEKKTSSAKILNDLQKIYNSAIQGKGDKLFLTESYSLPAKININTGELILENLNKFNSGKYELIPDIIDEIIEKVVLSKGSVFFLPDNSHKKYPEIEMFLRYT